MVISSPALLLNDEISNTGLSDSQAVNSVVVHPLVLLSVLDHHTRRQESSGRVIGTLLGRRDGDKVRLILILSTFRNSFVKRYNRHGLPHQSDQVNNFMLSFPTFSSRLTLILTILLHLCNHLNPGRSHKLLCSTTCRKGRRRSSNWKRL
jgi:hypothetical protein